MSIRRDKIKSLINLNNDSRAYFYSKIDHRWLTWLWENGFFAVLQERPESQITYKYTMPELYYLVRMAEENPKVVTDIILSIDISKESLNREVVDQFLRICVKLPATELARIVPKIRNEQWVPLMGQFYRWGTEYERMFKTLSAAEDEQSILALSEAVLATRTEEEIAQKSKVADDNPFYFDHLADTTVFDCLRSISNENLEVALSLTLNTLKQIVLKRSQGKKEGEFAIYDRFLLLNFDFFSSESKQKRHTSYREDIYELAVTVRELLQRIVTEYYNDKREVKRTYDEYVASLPDSNVMWRLRLYALSLCPEAFVNEVKESLFRVFTAKNYYELVSGTEYQTALGKTFSSLSNKDKETYINKVINYFTTQGKKNQEDKEWADTYASRLLSVIKKDLTPEQEQLAKKAGFKLESDYKPKPSMSEVTGGIVASKGTISQEEFENLSIEVIAQKMRDEWAPEELRKLNTHANFLERYSPEGIGNQLRTDMPKRLQDYVDSANLFFERDVLNAHYTYEYLKGIQEAIKNKPEKATKVKWDKLILMLTTLKESGKTSPWLPNDTNNPYGGWLSEWDNVHTAMVDTLRELVEEHSGHTALDFQSNREQVLNLLEYLLMYPEPGPDDEVIDRTSSTVKSPGEERKVSSPYSRAINSPRGRAFELLVLFVYLDGKQFAKGEKVKIKPDLKQIYADLLNRENTRAVMFLFGHYLPSFYYRDAAWLKGLLPMIFSTQEEKKFLYMAAWEGYLSTNLYEEIFFDAEFQKLYQRGLLLSSEADPGREYFTELEEGIASHLALALLYYKDFNLDSPLLELLWERRNTKQLKSFIGFIGRNFISREIIKTEEVLSSNSESIERIKSVWSKAIKEDLNSEVLEEFGYWVNLDEPLFEPGWVAQKIRETLEKTNGNLEWDYGLIKAMPDLAKHAPEEALKIAQIFLLEGGVRQGNPRTVLHIDGEWYETFKTLYENPGTKDETYQLIDDLIREGSQPFWKLEEIVAE